MIAVLAAAALTAAHASRTILFIGNSFTFGALSDAMTYSKDSVRDLNGDGMGGVPALFKRFADEAGLRYSVSLETAAGQTLAWHLANKRRNRPPVGCGRPPRIQHAEPEKPGDPSDTIPAVGKLAKLFRHRNRSVDISLVATGRALISPTVRQAWSGKPSTHGSGPARGGRLGARAVRRLAAWVRLARRSIARLPQDRISSSAPTG